MRRSTTFRPEPKAARLRLLATSDLHAQLWPFDYGADRPTEGVGLVRLASLIRAARAEVPLSLLLDNGDLLQGSLVADTAGARPHDGPHPILRAMAALGYDAATLGNHDFNYGLERLEHWLAGAAYPVVLANIVRHRGATPAGDTPFRPPYTILTRHAIQPRGGAVPIRIGIVGAAPPQTLDWDRPLLQGRLQSRGIVEALSHWVPAMREAGADIVVALCHSGLGDGGAAPCAEDAARAVAALPGVDAVIAGHSHRRLPGPDFAGLDGVDHLAGRLAGKPAVMPGAMGSDLGVIDLDLAHEAGIGWQVACATARLLPVAAAPPDPAVLAYTRRTHVLARRTARRPVGRLRARAHALFALAAHSPALTLVADAQAWRARALLGDAAPGPLLSAVAPFRAGGSGRPANYTDLPPGPLRRGQLIELAPFPNGLCVLQVTGADLRLWLERAAAGYARIDPGDRDAALTLDDAACYNFEQIHGLTYTIDLSRDGWFAPDGTALPRDPGAARIADLCHDGVPLAPGAGFAVATSTYRAAGGGGYGFLAECPRLGTADEPLVESLTAYVAGRPGLPGPIRPVWRFASLDATALFAAAPWADWARDGDGLRRIAPAGIGADGERLFRLHLGDGSAANIGSRTTSR